MARVEGVDPQAVSGYIKRTFEAQTKTWGEPLLNHLVYARRPALFRAVRGMWAGLNGVDVLDPGLVVLLNRRVAALNGCEF